jgi:DNA-binding NarL/FixJ family response regulator
MQLRTIHEGFPDAEESHEKEVRVLLADPDPIARHVLAGALRRAGGIDLAVASSDRTGMRDRPGGRLDAVLLATDVRDEPAALLAAWTAQRVPVLLIGTGWTPGRLRSAFAAGSAGCLVKDIATERLGAAVRAVASGHVVLSPELMAVFGQQPAPVQAPRPVPVPRSDPEGSGAALTDRELEVLDVLASGLSTVEAARQLGVSAATVKSHVSHSLTKLGARNRLEAVLMVRRAGRPLPLPCAV